jgi:hypothetical protein
LLTSGPRKIGRSEDTLGLIKSICDDDKCSLPCHLESKSLIVCTRARAAWSCSAWSVHTLDRRGLVLALE